MATPTAPKVAGKNEMDGMAVGQAIDNGQTTVDKVKQEASALAGEATDAARKAATQGKDKATEALTGLSMIAKDAAGAVDQHLGPAYGDYARKASKTVEDVANKLQEKDVDQLVSDATTFVKKRPAIAIGALAAVGLVIVGLFTGKKKIDRDNQV